MQGVWVLLAMYILGLVWRCDAKCDYLIDSRLKQKNENPVYYYGIFEWILEGDYEIVWMSSSSEQKIADKKGTKCLKIKFEKTKTGEQKIIYPNYQDKTFTVTLKNGALISSTRDDQGPVTLTHRFAYINKYVVAFYICSDAADDPSLSIVAISSVYSKIPEDLEDEVKKGKYFLEKEGIRGFAKLPTCSNYYVP